MNFYEMICFAKVYCAATGLVNPKSVSKQEFDVTADVLKKTADTRNDWTFEQKELYKSMVEFARQLTTGQ